MERLLSVLDRGAKRLVILIGRNGLICAAAMKTLKINFGNPMVVSFLKLKSFLDLAQNTNKHPAGLRALHQDWNMIGLKWEIEICNFEE